MAALNERLGEFILRHFIRNNRCRLHGGATGRVTRIHRVGTVNFVLIQQSTVDIFPCTAGGPRGIVSRVHPLGTCAKSDVNSSNSCRDISVWKPLLWTYCILLELQPLNMAHCIQRPLPEDRHRHPSVHLHNNRRCWYYY